ncbi:MAG: hypothetical protein ACPKOI_00075 [Pleomorphochaeta sp.]
MDFNTLIQDDFFHRFVTIIVADDTFPETELDIKQELIVNVLLNEFGLGVFKIETIIDFIFESINIQLSSCEIENSLIDVDYIIKVENENGIYYSISELYYKQFQESKKKNLDYYINEFILLNDVEEKINIKESINKYLYCIANNNLLEFQKISNGQQLEYDKMNEFDKFSSKEIELINKFLAWDNSSKNEIIYRLSNICMEYFLLTNTNEFDLLKKIGVENKNFFLDTNIIYRALGLNGTYLEKRIKLFLDKCIDTNQKLHITKFTEKEFYDSIAYYCKKLSQYNIKNPSVFINNAFDDDLYLFFYKWKIKHPNLNIESFITTIKSAYKNFINLYNIKICNGSLVNIYNENDESEIKNIEEKLNIYKPNNGYGVKYNKNFYDAANILYIERKRFDEGTDYSTIKSFFVSTDYHLFRWSNDRLATIPMVLLPSHWLSLMLRFVSRTNNDFSSFVSFINVPQKKQIIDNEKLNIIISGINEISEDVKAQELILNEIIDQKFFNIINSNKEDKIFDRTIKQSKRIKKEKIALLIKNNIEKEEKFDLEKQQLLACLDEEKKKNVQLIIEKKQIEEDKNQIKKKQEIIKYSIFKWLSLIGVIPIVVFFIFLFSFHNCKINIIWRFFIYLNCQENCTFGNFCIALLSGLIILLCGYLIKEVCSKWKDYDSKIKELSSIS